MWKSLSAWECRHGCLAVGMSVAIPWAVLSLSWQLDTHNWSHIRFNILDTKYFMLSSDSANNEGCGFLCNANNEGCGFLCGLNAWELKHLL